MAVGMPVHAACLLIESAGFFVMSPSKPLRARAKEVRGTTCESLEKSKRPISPDIPVAPSCRVQQAAHSDLLFVEKGDERTDHPVPQSLPQPPRNARCSQQNAPQEKKAVTSSDLVEDEPDRPGSRGPLAPSSRKAAVPAKTLCQLNVLDGRTPATGSTGPSLERAERRAFRP